MENKELTVERRLKIYKAALKYIQNFYKEWGYYNLGLCAAISKVTKTGEPNPYENMECYPEIYKYKPENAGINDYWFKSDEKGTQKRIAILTEVINSM